MSHIDPLASIHPDAQLGTGVSIGPFCVVESGVKIGDGCQLDARVTLKSGTKLGRENQISEGAVLGGRPQHLHAGAELGELIIGDGNQIRENATLHRGLEPGHNTTVGNSCFIMVGVHVAHDCHIGNHVIIANNTMLSGHVTIDDRAFLSGAVGVHQFCRVGSLAMVGGQAHVTRDVPPFVTLDGLSSMMVGINRVGLKRAGFEPEQIAQVKSAYRHAFCSELPWDEMVALMQSTYTDGPAASMAEFLTGGTRGFVRDRRGPRSRTLKIHSSDTSSSTPAELRKAG